MVLVALRGMSWDESAWLYSVIYMKRRFSDNELFLVHACMGRSGIRATGAEHDG